MTSMTSSVERTDLDFKISVALITDAEKEFEYSLRVVMDGYEYGLQL